MRKILVICLALIVCFGVQAKDKAPEISDISLEGAGNGQNGTILLNVTVSAKKADKVTNDVLVRSAVRMALFRGWNDRNKSSYGTSGASHPPICGEADAKSAHADYFNDFLGGEDVLNYGEVIPDTRKVLKKDKRYEVTATVLLKQKALRHKLEKDGIIRSLKSGW